MVSVTRSDNPGEIQTTKRGVDERKLCYTHTHTHVI